MPLGNNGGETQEIPVPAIREDFTEGDRVYSCHYNILSKGTVVYDPEEEKDHLSVWMDEGYQLPIHISCFVNEPGTYFWGRILPLSQVRVGTVISYLQEDGIRTYAEVRHIIPNQRVRMKRTVWPNEFFDHTAPDEGSLEDCFLDWEIEE